MRAVAIAAVLFLAASAAVAQAPRNGGEYGGLNHQPTQAEVVGRERADGVAPSRAQVDQDKRSVEQLDKQLLGAERKNPPRTAPSAAPPGQR